MLTGQVVVVAGGAGLLGRTFVRAIAEQGAIAVAADLNAASANDLANKAAPQKNPGRVEAATLDITDKASITALISLLQNRHGRIHAVVNCAYPRNSNYGRKLEDVTYADFCENVSLHLGGYFLVAQQFGLAFRAQGGGNIINLASIYGTITPRFEIYTGTSMTMPVEYAAIKSAIVHMTRYFARYFKGSNIRVNSLSPGGIGDGQPDSFLDAYNKHCGTKGMLDPRDIAGALLFLLSDASKYTTGQNIVVDDGFSV